MLTTDWRPIPGIPHYEVSDAGEVRHYQRKRPLTAQEQPNGYLAFYYRAPKRARRKKCYVHRAVALAFLGDPPHEGCTVDHYPDRCRQNNEARNLRWATPVEQSANRDVVGLAAEDFEAEEI